MEEMSNFVFFALTEGSVKKQSNLVPKKTKHVILKLKSKILFCDIFDWGRCSIRHISVVYINVMYLCSVHEREIQTPRESVERDHS